MQQLTSCPVCGYQPIYGDWIDEKQLFLVDCTHCTTFTITESLVKQFKRPLTNSNRYLKTQLSLYLRSAGDDDDRELTETSWRQLANG